MGFDENIFDHQGEHEVDESWSDQTWTDPWVENDLQDRKVKELPEVRHGYKRS